MIMKLDINDRAAIAIKNNTKRVEIRANKKYCDLDYSNLKENDIIEFTSNNLGVFYVKVIEVNHYDSLDELFTLEGTKYTTSSTNDKEEAIKNVSKLDGYNEAIKKNGVYAIHIEYLYSENTVWDELYEKTKNIRNLSNMISIAILTKNHNIYTGIFIELTSRFGMCEERNSIANIITNGENEIVKLVCIDSKGNVILPSSACIDFMNQLFKTSKNIEILKDIETKEIVKLEELRY